MDYGDFDLTTYDLGTPKLPSIGGSRSASPVDRSQLQRADPGLPLLQLSDWNPSLPYDESPPTCIHYSIEWKLLLNKGRVTKLTNDTEQNLVLAPGAFWNRTLKTKAEQLLEKKTPRNKCYKPDETNVVVSVTDRSERDLAKRFDELDIDWDVVEEQLKAWSRLFRSGKKLRIDISFICRDESQPIAMRTRQSTRRGVTATQLEERANILEEQEASGQPTVWSDVYSLMRCSGHICKNQGSFCWCEPDSKKHFGLDTNILTKMVRYAEEGNVLRTHKDVPQYIRDLIFAKEQQASERKLKRKPSFSESGRPIKIVNVMPSQYNQSSPEGVAGSSPEALPMAPARCAANFCIPKPRDRAIKSYCEWHCKQVDHAEWKASFRQAGMITLKEGFDLKHVHVDRDVEFYVTNGVKRGIARSFVEDVEVWVNEIKT